MIEYVPAIMLYSIGLIMLGYQIRKAKYESTLEQIEKIMDECLDKEEQHPNKNFTGAVLRPKVLQELDECIREYGESDESYRDRVLEIIHKYYPLDRA